MESHGAAQTRKIGRLLGRLLQPGCVVALRGELGSGKTEFVKGLACGLGVEKSSPVSSPSFVLVNEYPGRLPLYHLDLYRLSGSRDLEEIGLDEYLYGSGVTVIEWAEKAGPFLPPQHIWIDIEWAGPSGRRLVFKASGKANAEILRAALGGLGPVRFRRRI
ncbi:MAG: tRNA (adenosine(37)-N6)-threonylcarbamoyltransferase complex ATPase subunit type 1 TsaE [Deltaproteobacteria bacterium]|nr:tRNA (adenosine(37)-N6)-threonylcarbamoyltransferase complex ATPase subunit type 1 TsaE [Deltaproteobacteria bacterium]